MQELWRPRFDGETRNRRLTTKFNCRLAYNAKRLALLTKDEGGNRMALELFNHGNPETYHFIRWVIAQPSLTDRLVKSAFDAVEGDEWFKMGECPAVVARDKLAEALAELLQDAAAQVDVDEDGPYQPEGPLVGDTVDALLKMMLALSIRAVDCTIAAEAVLRHCNRWAPDRDLPEIK
jgi:hypothetical protein